MELDNTHVPIKYIIYSNRDIRILSEAMKQLKGDFTKDLHRVMKGTIESDMYIQLLFNFENTKPITSKGILGRMGGGKGNTINTALVVNKYKTVIGSITIIPKKGVSINLVLDTIDRLEDSIKSLKRKYSYLHIVSSNIISETGVIYFPQGSL